MNIFELPERDFLAMLPELAQQGVDTDDLRRRYREANSLAGPAAQRAQADVVARGRRPVAGGLLSKPEGATGMDAVRGLEFEPMAGLLNALAGAERAITAPAQANLIPQPDMNLEALATAGMAMTGGGAVAVPDNSLRAFALRGGGTSDPTQTGWTFRDVDASLNRQLSGAENRRIDADTSRVENVPIRSLRAMQETVNPDFATTTSSAGELPLVVRKDGKMFVRDGHHRLTRIAEEGGQTANVRFIDLDNADTSTPLLDWSPEKTGFVEADNELLDMLFSANADEATGLLAMSAADTPAKQMARRILELRAAGRASEVTDDMMAAADPVYMFNNTPLPMDEASRLARAREMGFSEQAVHGTNTRHDFSAFRGPTRYGNWDESYFSPNTPEGIEFSNGFAASDQGRMYPVMLKGDEILDTRTDAGMAAFRGGLEDADMLRRYDWGEYSGGQIRKSGLPGWGDAQVIQETLRRNPQGMRLHERDWVESIAVGDPSNIRSRFARFDPEFSHLSNLSAANASAPAGLLAMPAQEPQEQKLPFMSLLKGLLQ